MLLSAQHISKSYGSQVVLDDISLTIYPGEIVGLLGRNGAGKSTLLKILSRINLPDIGEVEIEAPYIGYMSEGNPLYPYMYVREYLAWVCAIRQLQDTQRRISWVIDRVGLMDVLGKRIHQLSKGYRQRVGLAATLLPDPDIIILDEPINGLDPAQITEYRGVIKEIAHNKIIILSSHLMQEIEALCDRVLLLEKGKITEIESFTHGHRQIRLEVDAPLDISSLLSIEGVLKVDLQSDSLYYIYSKADVDVRADIFDTIVQEGYKILELSTSKSSLNQLFE